MQWFGLRRMVVVAALIGGISQPAFADLTIDVTGGEVNPIPIMIVPFTGELGQGQPVSPVVNADLTRSGMFRSVDASGVQMDDQTVPNYDALKSRGMDVILVGSVKAHGGGQVDVRYRLLDEAQQREIMAFSFTVPPQKLRAIAHKISDQVYAKLTGGVGVFSTRIMYVEKRGSTYQLMVADYDGYNPQAVATSKAPLMSPAWSPDGKRIAYVSFEARRPEVIVQSLLTGRRRVVAAFKGNNSGPAWSPDGQHLAIVLTKDGHSQIYEINADGSGLKRLTSSIDIDTEPKFTPDGQSIVFTSDRGGNPQIYRMSVSGGYAQRLTFTGKYNVSPAISPDGKMLAFVQRREGHFQLASMTLNNGLVTMMTDDDFDESPSFAPNGKMIIYALQVGGRGMLAVVSSDGRVKQKLWAPTGDISNPVWGPLLVN